MKQKNINSIAILFMFICVVGLLILILQGQIEKELGECENILYGYIVENRS